MTGQERQLIEQAAAGDSAAFEQLVSQYEKLVYSVTFRMTGNREDALDLSQETFIKVWKSLAFFKFESSFSTWIYRIAGNVCLDFLRRQKRVRSLTVSDEEVQLDLPDERQDPERTVMELADQQELSAALSTLEPEYRAALTLRAVAGLSYQEIADALNIQTGTVKSRISRGRERLRKKLAGRGNNRVCEPSNTAKGGEDA